MPSPKLEYSIGIARKEYLQYYILLTKNIAIFYLFFMHFSIFVGLSQVILKLPVNRLVISNLQNTECLLLKNKILQKSELPLSLLLMYYRHFIIFNYNSLGSYKDGLTAQRMGF